MNSHGAHLVEMVQATILIKQTLVKDRTQTPLWKAIFLRLQGGSNYELVVFLDCKPANSLV